MRGAIRLALCLLGLVPARADDGRRSRLLVAYVAGRDAVSEKRIGPVPIPYSAQQSAATAPAKPRWRHTTCASSKSQLSSHTCGGAGWGSQPCACAA